MKKKNRPDSVRTMCLFGLAAVTITLIASTAISDPEAPQEKSEDKPLLSFGMITDIQYADRDNVKNRCFRQSLENLKECVRQLNAHKELAFTIQLGDIINGNTSKAKNMSDLDATLKVFNQLSMPKYHVIGNHCLIAGRKTLEKKLELEKFYYSFTLPKVKGWRFIVLDSCEFRKGKLTEIISQKQLEWLESELEKAKKRGEKVIIFSHVPPLMQQIEQPGQESTVPLLKLLPKFTGVVAWFSGHVHQGGYIFCNRIHMVTEKGVVENPKDNAYAIVKIYPDRIEEIGYGAEPSRTLKFDKARQK